jgi:succinate dehydrogenase/fumarate reductase-like Fe-S protein
VAGQKEMTKDAETGKMKDKPKGLGKWRCTACGKVAKVTPRKPEPKGEVRAVKGADLGRGTEVPNATS